MAGYVDLHHSLRMPSSNASCNHYFVLFMHHTIHVSHLQLTNSHTLSHTLMHFNFTHKRINQQKTPTNPAIPALPPLISSSSKTTTPKSNSPPPHSTSPLSTPCGRIRLLPPRPAASLATPAPPFWAELGALSRSSARGPRI